MASVIPAFVSAIQDKRLRGHPREVYIWCHEHLDIREFRAVKHAELELALEISDMAVARSVDRLVDLGYLDRGAREGRLFTYRLFYSVKADSRAILPTKCG